MRRTIGSPEGCRHRHHGQDDQPNDAEVRMLKTSSGWYTWERIDRVMFSPYERLGHQKEEARAKAPAIELASNSTTRVLL